MRVCDQVKELSEIYEQINMSKRHILGAITHSSTPDEEKTDLEYFAFLESIKKLNNSVKTLNIKILSEG